MKHERLDCKASVQLSRPFRQLQFVNPSCWLALSGFIHRSGTSLTGTVASSQWSGRGKESANELHYFLSP